MRRSIGAPVPQRRQQAPARQVCYLPRQEVGALNGFGPATFGELNAEDYDELHDPGTTEAAVALLADLAQGGRALELAIGTGRIALPLAARGLSVYGVDASPEMVAKLRAKPGGDAIPVLIGDIAMALLALLQIGWLTFSHTNAWRAFAGWFMSLPLC